MTQDSWIGLDESGKGDYFGPLVVAGVRVDPAISARLIEWGIKDSKRLSDKRVLKLDPMIRKACRHAIVAIGPERYNDLYAQMRNLNKLLAWAHARTLENILIEEDCSRAIADQFGDKKLILNALMNKGRKIELEQRHRAEQDPAVAAASILARAGFLNRLKKLSVEHAIDLPKGASAMVKSTALALVKNRSEDILNKLAKRHFKITAEILRECQPR